MKCFSGTVNMFGTTVQMADDLNKKFYYAPPLNNYEYGGFYVKMLDTVEISKGSWFLKPRTELFESFNWKIWVTLSVSAGLAQIVKLIACKFFMLQNMTV